MPVRATTQDTTPVKRISLAEAKAQAAHWDAMWEQQCYEDALATHFRDASASQVVAMWESQTNEKGQALSPFEFRALCSCWIETFGALPPDHEPLPGAAPAVPPEPEPADDTMLTRRDVSRLTGLSMSTLKRRQAEGTFPVPMQLGPRRIGWPASEIKTWPAQLDEQRRAPRQ